MDHGSSVGWSGIHRNMWHQVQKWNVMGLSQCVGSRRIRPHTLLHMTALRVSKDRTGSKWKKKMARWERNGKMQLVNDWCWLKKRLLLIPWEDVEGVSWLTCVPHVWNRALTCIYDMASAREILGSRPLTQTSSEYKWTCAPLLEGKTVGHLCGYFKRDFNSMALHKQQLLYSKPFRLIVWIFSDWIHSTQCFCWRQQWAIMLTSVGVGVDLRFWMASALAIIKCLQRCWACESLWQLLDWVHGEKKYCSGYFLLHHLLVLLQLFLGAAFCCSVHQPSSLAVCFLLLLCIKQR